jgi:aspartyl-tRNA(Asn)/glutamyl-tRNA(Gln) amidotransferase subunit C
LELDEAEIAKYQTEMSDILQFVEQLQDVNVNGIEPTHQVTGLTNVTRPDVVKNYGYKVEKLLENVPAVKNKQIKVKRMLG